MTADSAAYQLQPGDTVRFDLIGLPDASVQARINPGGVVDLGVLGRLKLGGLTLDKALEAARSEAERRAFPRYMENGDLFVLPIQPRDLRLSVVAFRPITVTGAITGPGRFDFEPGMTVRAALGLAGGLQAGGMMTGAAPTPEELIRYRDIFDRAALDKVSAEIAIWALQARVAENMDPDAPALQGPLSGDDTAPLLADARKLIRADIQTARDERAFFVRSLEQMRQRLGILTAQRGELQGLLDADEAEVARIQELISRGVAPASLLIEVKRVAALSSARLLEVEEKLSRVQLDITELERRQSEFDQERQIELLNEFREARGDLLRATLDMRRGARLLAGQSIPAGNGATDLAPRLEASVIAHRGAGEASRPVAVALDDLVHPGDVLEVQLLPATDVHSGQ
ncbi:hypothetical protein PGB28_14305 [Primorskyibacter aestuariivivens]|uniref:polysaccharide biosynthesis/export family protein n=1 Tax=Primorskyibacter aestuariivivens TaxID=1888912 RepID=UPI00230138A8|nr:polysaccharide biosynthesis/export family protein [Primorskyibacter aestuariivivens]MDA7429639.1 hypothetical protein [Primorskyibacter aestuariivivens]